MPAHLLAQPVGDLRGQLGDRGGVDPARPFDHHREFRQHAARAAAQHHHPVPEPNCLPHVVSDEQDGQVPLGGDPVELVVQHVPGHRVERAERLVHEQHVRVLGEGAGQRDPLPHAAGQLVR
jgi:hypothetical protein